MKSNRSISVLNINSRKAHTYTHEVKFIHVAKISDFMNLLAQCVMDHCLNLKVHLDEEFQMGLDVCP